MDDRDPMDALAYVLGRALAGDEKWMRFLMVALDKEHTP